ncbi:hypothetical protein BUALT_Bualt10G0014100 [Buddleja alternifolia]|uniref:Transcription factor n=1 Tax=Buddleja alternifolia TaxID=168488 RepID=A0AAV6X2G0_9LAMI|nr:hypothetical protein BUALT_Bualt10G0014100 [Buddleja alternifolia]
MHLHDLRPYTIVSTIQLNRNCWKGSIVNSHSGFILAIRNFSICFLSHDAERKRKLKKVAAREHRKKVLRELNSLISGTQSTTNDDAVDEEVTGVERLAASHYEWAQQAHGFGLQTLVCIPSSNGVLKLGSTELIFQSSDLMNKTDNISGVESDHSDLEASVVKAVESGRVVDDPDKPVLPNVSKMYKASLLGDAITYINGLKSEVQNLESDNKELRSQIVELKKELSSKEVRRPAPPPPDHDLKMSGNKKIGMDIDVKIIGWDAMIRVQSNKKNHPMAKLMAALKKIWMRFCCSTDNRTKVCH